MMAPPPIFQVGHLERMPLGTPYPGIVAHVGRLLGKLPTGTELVIDITGVGKARFRDVHLCRNLAVGRVDQLRGRPRRGTARSAACRN
jgi:hypothetical protein